MQSMIIQYVFILILSMVPFFEVFITVPIGIIVFDFPPIVVLMVSMVGNVSSVLFFMYFGGWINRFVYMIRRKLGKTGRTQKGMNPRMKKTFDRFGVNGVCFFVIAFVQQPDWLRCYDDIRRSKKPGVYMDEPGCRITCCHNGNIVCRGGKFCVFTG